MKKTIISAILASSAAALGLYACSTTTNNGGSPSDAGLGFDQTTPGDDTGSGSSGSGSGSGSGGPADTGGSDTGTAETGPADSGNNDGSDGNTAAPAPPTLGTQIDRMGRPAVNTALNHTFDPNPATAGPAKDAYNADTNPTTWKASYSPEFAKNLAIYDGLDTICGNQALYGTTPGGYSYLAGAFAGDMLIVDTRKTTCTQYFGVELNASGVMPNTDCGGRTLSENVIDFIYTSASGSSTPVTNGITQPASPPLAVFPYMAVPH